METKQKKSGNAEGKYLSRSSRKLRTGRWVAVLLMLLWDGLLLYMILDCLIESVYGAAFVGIVSVYMGYQI